MIFREHDIVRVPEERGTAEIRGMLDAMNSALLKTAIGGFRRWHQDEIRLERHGKPKQRNRRRS
jgi:hypothetical protein